MSGKRIGGIVCLVLACMFLLSGASSLTRGDGPAIGDRTGLGVSHAVGAFLPALVAAVVGLRLLQKPGRRNPGESGA